METLTHDVANPKQKPRQKPIPRPSPDSMIFTIEGVRAVTGLPRTTVYEMIGKKVLEGRKVGRRTMVTGESLRAFVNSLPPTAIADPRKTAA